MPVGEVWPIDGILSLKEKREAHGLTLEVIESVPVHEDIKLGAPTCDRLIANYGETWRNLGSCGVKVVCYNSMPVFDWTRTSVGRPAVREALQTLQRSGIVEIVHGERAQVVCPPRIV